MSETIDIADNQPSSFKDGSSSTRKSVPLFMSAIILWTLLVLVLAGWSYWQTLTAAEETARNAALDSFDKDLVYRQWATNQGGVYAPVTPQTPPNPYLTQVPERDIVTPSGKKLTLINPAYMTRQVHELGAQLYGLRGHITSLKPIRPQNAPDAWETAALLAFENGKKEVVSFEKVGDEKLLRFMRPLIVNQGCLPCHADQGYKVGDIRGGISVSVPWAPYQHHVDEQMWVLIIGYGGIWGIGIVGMQLGRKNILRRIAQLAVTSEALRESEIRYRRLFDAMNAGFALHEIILDADAQPIDYRFIDVNRAFERMTGFKAPDFIGKTVMEVLPGTEKYWIEAYGAVALGGGTRTFENYSKELGRYFEVTAYSPSPGQFATIIQDITARKRVDEELKASESRYRELFEAESDAILLIDNQTGKIVEANSAALALYGYPREEFLSKNNTDMSAEKEETQRVTQKTPIQPGNVITIPLRYHRRKDGSVFPVEITGRFFMLHDRPVHIAAIRDITQRRKTEEEIRENQERLQQAIEELDSFAHVVSHDLQAPLRRISSYVDLIHSSLAGSTDENINRYLDAVRTNTRDLFELVDSLLEFSRAKRTDLFRQQIDLSDVASRLLDELRQDDAGRAVECVVKPTPKVWADSKLMRAALQNLLANAWKFTGHTEHARIEFGCDIRDGEKIYYIRDNGAGFDMEHADKLFKPFTRLHEASEFKGRGVGLSTAARIIVRHGGRIWAEAKPGEGATFHFTIPEPVEKPESGA